MNETMSGNELSEADLNNLIAVGAAENRTIEYKRELPSNAREGKKEYYADVSSFANGAGGRIFYGVVAEEGIPKSLSAISTEESSADEAILRLESMAQSGIKPRIPGIRICPISLASGKYVIVIHIPKSWCGPHVVDFDGHWRFYSRNSTGKYPLDVAEVRNAFLGGAAFADKLRSFRMDRVARITARELSVRTDSPANVVLHFVPIRAFEPSTFMNISTLIRQTPQRCDLTLSRYKSDMRPNAEGLKVVWANLVYTQVFRNGIIEFVSSLYIHDNLVQIADLHKEMLGVTKECVRIEKVIEGEPPFFVLISLTGVAGYKYHVGEPLNERSHRDLYVESNDVTVPDVVIDDSIADVEDALRPALDVLWNAGGYERPPG